MIPKKIKNFGLKGFKSLEFLKALALLTLFAPPAFSQTTDEAHLVSTLSLQQTIEIASDSSLQAFIAKNQYLYSYWEFRSFKAARLPSLNLTMTPLQYYRNNTRRYDFENNVDVYREQQSLYSSGNLSVVQNFDLTGGTFYIDTELGYIRNFGESVYSQYTSVPLRIGYRQSLFGFNSFKWEKQIEPLKYKKAKQQFIADRENISVTSIEYFFNLAMAQSEYDMAVDNLASADTLYQMGEERKKIAAISQADLLTLKLDIINSRNTLKNAEISLKRAMTAFVSFLNLNKGTQIRLALPDRPKNIEISVEEAASLARENNPGYLANRQKVLEAEQSLDQAVKSALFNADFNASVGFNQVAPTFRTVYTNPSQQDVVSVSFTVPLIDWGVRKGKANMARNNLMFTQISAQQDEISLDQDVLMTVSDFNVQQGMIESAEEAVSLANQAYRETKERFIIGKADINSLTLSLNRQKDAQKNYLSALKNYWVSYYKIRQMTLYDFERGRDIEVELRTKMGGL
ncbi:MAG: TolC family protein [Dysgonamonadaceae bacterium]|jgi:outer membrane protein TolC|nr:TolC family protein [Dysgonamonadaceae bacterium]